MEKAFGYVKVYLKETSSSVLPGQIKQKNEIRKYCEQNHIFLEKIIVEKVFDEKADTPLFNDLIFKRNNDDSLTKVIVYKSSILSSDNRFYLYCCFSFARRGIELVSIKEDYAKESKITQRDKSLVYAMAYYEKKRMGYLLQDGRKQKMLSGDYVSGTSPYGYKKINGKYVVDTSESEVVKLIFKMKEKTLSVIMEYISFQRVNRQDTSKRPESCMS